MKVLTFKSGAVEKYLLWKKDLDKVCIGQNVVDAPNKYAMTRRLLDGDALAAFNIAAQDAGNETTPHYNATMKALARHIFPKNALATQRQWFHRYMSKTPNITIHEYVARINEINSYMSEFPPAFNRTQAIGDDEMKDLLEFSIPWTWRVEMVRQAFRSLEHDIPDIVEFCERQEICEAFFKPSKNTSKAQSNTANMNNKNNDYKRGKKAGVPGWSNKNKRKGQYVSYNKSNGRSGCRLHPTSVTHQTADCQVIQNQIDNMKATYAAQSRDNGYKRQKTGNFKLKSNKNPSTGDLHTLFDTVEKVKSRLEKELCQRTTENGKRKLREFESTEETSTQDLEAKKTRSLDNFTTELDQMSLSDVDDLIADLEPLDSDEFAA